MKKTILYIVAMFAMSLMTLQMVLAEDLFPSPPPTATYVVNPYIAYTYEDMQEDIALLSAMYPDIIKTKSIGKSVEGRELPVLELGKGSKKISLVGTLHAREYIASAYVMYFVDRAAFDYKNSTVRDGHNVPYILDNVTFCILPMANPDGVNLVQNGWSATSNPKELQKMIRRDGANNYGYKSWKANIKGEDLNNNFANGWGHNGNGVHSPASAGFNGYAPESAPEIQHLTNYMEAVQPNAVLAIHTQGKVLYLSRPDETAKNIANNIIKATGYQAMPKGSKQYGSFQDYVDGTFNVLYCNVELCNYVGPFPYDNSKFDRVWESAKDVCYITAEGLLK